MLRIIKKQKVELLTSIYLSVLWPISLPLFSIKVFDDVTIEQHAALMCRYWVPGRSINDLCQGHERVSDSERVSDPGINR